MTDLSPAANAVWEAFNQDEAGVFVDYGDKLAAALRAAADQVAPETAESEQDDPEMLKGIWSERRTIRAELLAIAAELADEPAVPEGREPASVITQPSDEEAAELSRWLAFEAENALAAGRYFPASMLTGASEPLARWSNLMTNPFRVLILAVFLPAAAWIIWVNLHTIVECHAAGGTVVQGLFSLECIR